MVDIHITSVMEVDNLGLVAVYALFNLFKQIEPVERIKAVVWKVQQFHAVGSEDLPGLLRRLRQGGELIAGLIAIALLLAGSSTLGHYQHLHLIAGIGVPRDAAAAAQHFVVWVRGDN